MQTLKNKWSHLTIVLFLAFTQLTANAYDLVVAKDGSGNYTTVQAAINAAPASSIVPYTIFVKNGKYREKINIAANKTFIQVIGESVANTILYYDDPATVLGTQNSASFTVNANDFSAINITFSNAYGDGSQAVAIVINADRAAFSNCRFMANQDTVYTKGSGVPRAYFKSCYIDGNVDFIFGNTVAIFDSCVVYAKSRTAAGSSYITAANTPSGQAYGYLFRDCKLPANTGGTVYYLGRPWQNSTSSTLPLADNNTVFMNCTLGAGQVSPLGWTVWDAGTNTALINYAEYKSKNFDGSLVDVSARVAWAKQLSDIQAANYTMANLFGAWDPCTISAGFCYGGGDDIAVSNFRVAKLTATAKLDWNISWPMTGIRYQVFRSSDNVSFGQVYETTALNDTSVNFQYTDPALPPANGIYYYYVLASKAGLASHITDTLQVSSKPTITTTSSALGTFAQGIGIPSVTQTYAVSGVNLTGNVTITPPVGFEISGDGGTTWFTAANPLILIPAGNTLASTTITVRMNAPALGDYSGNIVHSAANADNVNVALSGTCSATPPIPIVVLQRWPLTADNLDDAAVRSPAVTASVPVFNKLYSSNGTTANTTAVPPYSDKNGQAFGPAATGEGLWSTGSGGPGGNLNRTFYEQFTVTAQAGYTVQVDSLVLNASFFNSSSNTKFAVVYSKNAFGSPADSTDISGTDSSGTTMPDTRYGAFTKPIFLGNQTGGPISRYGMALNGATGVTLAPGETLTLRLYFSCSSSSNGRYATIKNVQAKGAVFSTVPLQLLSFTGGYNNRKVSVQWNTVNESNTRYFQVERSANGTSFTSIGEIAAKNAGATSNYSFQDNAPLPGTGYYRLKIADKDGKVTYSQILRIESSGKGLIISIYPNPVKNELVISYPITQQGALVNIMSADGKKMFTQQLASGTTSSVLSIGHLPAGNYWLTYANNGTRLTGKFLKR